MQLCETRVDACTICKVICCSGIVFSSDKSCDHGQPKGFAFVEYARPLISSPVGLRFGLRFPLLMSFYLLNDAAVVDVAGLAFDC
eukprot:m.93332 g.93332  ORF g.93332 m.93332 type:complete len:85 (+) comp14983_c0_seq10:86-340(+)